jgi:hypothetical protein
MPQERIERCSILSIRQNLSTCAHFNGVVYRIFVLIEFDGNDGTNESTSWLNEILVSQSTKNYIQPCLDHHELLVSQATQ